MTALPPPFADKSPEALKQQREMELRLYLVIRTDLRLSPEDVVSVAAEATWRAVATAMAAYPERFAAYDAEAQPKIGVRAKSEAQLQRALQAVRDAGLPVGTVDWAPGLPVALGIGPVSRHELPAFVRGLQIIGDSAPGDEATPLPPRPDPAPDHPRLWLGMRDDIGIPFGKRVPQAGHGCWAALRQCLVTGPREVEQWQAAGCPVGLLDVPDLRAMQEVHSAGAEATLPAALIVDAGRTVFGRPTPTVVAIGPCLLDDLPLGIRSRALNIAPDELDCEIPRPA